MGFGVFVYLINGSLMGWERECVTLYGLGSFIVIETLFWV